MVASDVDGLLTVFGDPVVMAAFDVPRFDRARMEAWVGRNLDHQRDHGYGLFTLVDRADGSIAGDCGLELLDDGSGDVELGYDLRSDLWGRGLATEAAAAVRDHALGALRLRRLVSLIREGNLRSQRVAEKIGMRHEADVERFGARYRRYALSAEAVREQRGAGR